MRNRGAQLLELQEVENDLRDRIAAFKKIQQYLTRTSPAQQARQSYEVAQSAEREARSEQQDVSLEWEGLIQKVDEEEKKLYSGDISNPKELENLQLEVEHLKKRRAKLEEQALELIERVDGLSQETASSKEEYEQLTEDERHKQEQLEAQQDKLRRYIAKRKREREELIKHIDPSDLEQYRYVQRIKNDTHAVATLENGVCGACHIEVSASKRNRVEREDKSDLVMCGNCGRILVF